METFTLAPGNDAVQDSLRAALATRFPQSVLFAGACGSGKFRLGLWLAAALLCTGAANKPCGSCSSCRKIAGSVHPDLTIVDEGDADLPVALARQLRQDATVLPNDGERKVYILRHAHKLNTIAQNALLKLLEEPPHYAFFILETEQPNALLETIRSRCTTFQLAPPSDAQAAPDPDTTDKLSRFLQALAARDEYQMLRAAMELEKLSKPAFQAAMGYLQAALHDALQNGLPGNAVPPLNQAARALSAQISAARLIRLYDFLAVLSNRCEVNAAPVAQCAALCASAFQICS